MHEGEHKDDAPKIRRRCRFKQPAIGFEDDKDGVQAGIVTGKQLHPTSESRPGRVYREDHARSVLKVVQGMAKNLQWCPDSKMISCLTCGARTAHRMAGFAQKHGGCTRGKKDGTSDLVRQYDHLVTCDEYLSCTKCGMRSCVKGAWLAFARSHATCTRVNLDESLIQAPKHIVREKGYLRCTGCMSMGKSNLQRWLGNHGH